MGNKIFITLCLILVLTGAMFAIVRMVPVHPLPIVEKTQPNPATKNTNTPPIHGSLITNNRKDHVLFKDVSSDSGLRFKHIQVSDAIDSLKDVMGSGVCFLDFNSDHYQDIFFVNGSGYSYYYGNQPWWYKDKAPTHALFRNNQDGTFTDVTRKARLAINSWGMGCTVGDYDNDGHPDLFITNYGPNILFRNNGNGAFTDVTQQAILGTNRKDRWNSGAVWGDYDRDGWLDLYVLGYLQFDKHIKPAEPNKFFTSPMSYLMDPGLYTSQSNILYRNNGDGTFKDVTKAAGVEDFAGKGLGVVFSDLNHDGYPDIYIANDGSRNVFFRNNGNGTFTEIGAEAGVDTPQSAMGVTVGDYDNDGLLDLFSTTTSQDTNVLYRNRSRGSKRLVSLNETKIFEEVSVDSGLGENVAFGQFGWGSEFFDFDNDGFLDLFVSNGYPGPDFDNPKTAIGQKNQLFQNLGNGGFVDATPRGGEGLKSVKSSRGFAAGDYDNDGDMDVLIGNNNDYAMLLRNEGGVSDHWLNINLIGVRSNKDGIGSKVFIGTGPSQQIREIRSGSGYLSQSDMRAHFGLGRNEKVDWIEVRWPSGFIQTFQNVKADQFITIREDEDQIQIIPINPPNQTNQKNKINQINKRNKKDQPLKDSERLRLEIIRAIGKQRGEKALPRLIKLLESPVPEIRAETVDALSGIGGDPVYQPLLGMVADPDSAVRSKAIRALARYHTDEAIDKVIVALGDPHEAVRFEAARTIGVFLEEEQTILRATIHKKRMSVIPLLQLLKDPSPKVRAAVIEALGYSESYRAVVPVMERVEDPSQLVRREAVLTLGLLRDRRATQILLKIVENHHEAPQVRSAAVLSLVRLESDVTVEPLLDLLAGESLEKKRGALQTLKHLLTEKESVLIKRNNIKGPLLDCLGEEEQAVRVAAIETLSLIRDPEVVIRLGKILEDQHREVQKEIVSALGNIQDPDGGDFLLPFLEKEIDKELKEMIILTLGHLANRSAVAPLAKILENPKSDVALRVSAMKSLKTVDPGAIMRIISILEEDPHPRIKTEVIQFLAAQRDPKRLGFFLKHISKEFPVEVRKAAVSALSGFRSGKSVEGLVDMIRRENEPDELKSAAVSTLGKMGDPRALDPLMRIARDKENLFRLEAIQAMSGFQNERVSEFLLTVVKDKEEPLTFRTTALSVIFKRSQGEDGMREILAMKL